MKLADLVQIMRRQASEADAMACAIVFTHVDPETQNLLHFCVGALQRDPRYLALEIVGTPVEAQAAEMIMEKRGIERHRLDSLLSADPQMLEPVTYALMPDQAHLLIDGSHRYVAYFMHHAKHMPARVVPEELWREFILDEGELPPMSEQEILSSDSKLDSMGRPIVRRRRRDE